MMVSLPEGTGSSQITKRACWIGCAPLVLRSEFEGIQLAEVLCEGDQAKGVKAEPQGIAPHLGMVCCESLQVGRTRLQNKVHQQAFLSSGKLHLPLEKSEHACREHA